MAAADAPEPSPAPVIISFVPTESVVATRRSPSRLVVPDPHAQASTTSAAAITDIRTVIVTRTYPHDRGVSKHPTLRRFAARRGWVRPESYTEVDRHR